MIIVLIQLIVVIVAYVASFLLALDLNLSDIPTSLLLQSLPLLLVARLGSMGLFRLFHGLWRYVSTRDLFQVVKASTVGSAIFVPAAVAIFGAYEFPRSVFILDWAGNIFLLAGVRAAVRLLHERRRPLQPGRGPSRRLLIVGAGDAGAKICHETLISPQFGFTPVAFIDDDPRKHGTTIVGVPVAGASKEMQRVAEQYRIDTIVIAIPSATAGQMRSLVDVCQGTGIPFKTLPGMPALLEPGVTVTQRREVDLGDLLGRPQARLDRTSIESMVRGKRILVTGAAGSVGSELARLVAKLEPELLLLIDHAENPLLFIEAEIRAAVSDRSTVAVEIGDVTDEASMSHLMGWYHPHLVFHTAAHKHVTFMERAPAEAVKNNMGGTYVVAHSALQADVEKFVLVSTDKAVNPTSVMGVTKRIAELMIQELNQNGSTLFITVRFGNVLGSAGSVVPIFMEQIAKGGPITVTDPNASRYFMSISEAAELIMQAAAVGRGGECFVLDMGEPVKIVEIAETLISLSGLKPYEDIQIVYTGLNSGEKLSEQLHSDDEKPEPTEYEKLLVVRPHYASREVLHEAVELWHRVSNLTRQEIIGQLQVLAPEYQPASGPTPQDRIGRASSRRDFEGQP